MANTTQIRQQLIAFIQRNDSRYRFATFSGHSEEHLRAIVKKIKETKKKDK